MNFKRYKTNLTYDREWVYSYNTPVGRISNDLLLICDRFWNATTTKHLHYAARELGLKLIKNY